MTSSVRKSLFGRRDFIRLGSVGTMGLTLADALRGRPKKDMSCIFLFQAGGAPHLDTFDMKPDAPKEIRGEFKPIPTNVPGIQICELLPNTAKVTDKYLILRTMYTDQKNHERAGHYLLTGYLPLASLEFPNMGAVVSKELGSKNGMPPYVVTPKVLHYYGGGFLGGEYNPFIGGDANIPGYQVRDLSLPTHMDLQQVGDRQWLLKKVDAKFRAIESSPEFASLDSFYHRAYDLLSSPAAKKAFDIESEPRALRERYGRTPVGQGTLLARRLVEAGVRFVTIANAWQIWDTHADNFNGMRILLPEFDMAFASLLQDLDERGLLDTTLVIAMGEFGRTPKINAAAGRDHHQKCWSICLAGAGITGGRILGSTDSTGTEITDLPVSIEDLYHSVYTLLGIDPGKEYHTSIGRPVKLANGGKMIKGLVG
ncbi:MAG: DUF1501 domain-containing protein [Bryobacteraceae bacterium]